MKMDFSYLLTPFLAWLVAGLLKFAVNSIKTGKPAFGLIGYGGMPSNHSTIVSSMAALIAFREGLDHPAFGVALTLAFIVMLDAGGLRREIGRHATALNRLTRETGNSKHLREHMGHTPTEIGAGIITGIVVAALVNAAAG